MTIYFHESYNDTGVEFDTLRKAMRVAEQLRARGTELVAPDAIAAETAGMVHSPGYIDALITGEPARLAASQGIGWDSQLFAAVCASTGGVVSATDEALQTGAHCGSLSSGLHHARRDNGAGYCTINGLAIAAHLAARRGASVLILDFDAHCGGGTAELIDGVERIRQIDVSVIAFDTFETNEQSHLTMAGADDYLQEVDRALERASAGPRPDVVLYNAGMDPHERAGGIAGITTDMLETREQMVFDWARSQGVPVAWVLAGGYQEAGFSLDEVAALHVMTADAALA